MLLALAINIFSKSANVNNGRHFEIKFCRQLVQCTVSLVQLCASLQNRRNFLRILGEWRRKGGEREARVAREGKSAPLLARNSRFALASRSPRFRLYSPKGPSKRGHVVADTLLPMMFLVLRKLGNI